MKRDMNNTNDSWEKRYDDEFNMDIVIRDPEDTYCCEDDTPGQMPSFISIEDKIKKFIAQEIERAREEGLKDALSQLRARGIAMDKKHLYAPMDMRYRDEYIREGYKAGLQKALDVLPEHQIVGHNDEHLPDRNSRHIVRYWDEYREQAIENIKKEMEK